MDVGDVCRPESVSRTQGAACTYPSWTHPQGEFQPAEPLVVSDYTRKWSGEGSGWVGGNNNNNNKLSWHTSILHCVCTRRRKRGVKCASSAERVLHSSGGRAQTGRRLCAATVGTTLHLLFKLVPTVYGVCGYTGVCVDVLVR